jgi:3-isopropylmalate/(R)-2-methylmalate dehydratase large subunit
MADQAPRTLFDKVWDAHVVLTREDGQALLLIDRHFFHEGSHHAFNQLAARGARVPYPTQNIGVVDHYIPTHGPRNRGAGAIADPTIRRMVEQVTDNAARHGLRLFGLDSPGQGIVHVVGPEQGLTLPGLTIVCGDSHTSTHGAFGALAFGIGASEVAHVLMTQTLWQRRPGRMRIAVEGELGPGIGAKDVALSIIARIGADGAARHAVEYAGSAIRALSMEGRLTLCNLASSPAPAAAWWRPTRPRSPSSAAAPLRPRAPNSTGRRRPGWPCPVTRTPPSTAR